MIITLNSTNKFNYQFTNDFNETLTLKADSIIKVKNINVTKKFSVEITDDNRSFTLMKQQTHLSYLLYRVDFTHYLN